MLPGAARVRRAAAVRSLCFRHAATSTSARLTSSSPAAVVETWRLAASRARPRPGGPARWPTGTRRQSPERGRRLDEPHPCCSPTGPARQAPARRNMSREESAAGICARHDRMVAPRQVPASPPEPSPATSQPPLPVNPSSLVEGRTRRADTAVTRAFWNPGCGGARACDRSVAASGQPSSGHHRSSGQLHSIPPWSGGGRTALMQVTRALRVGYTGPLVTSAMKVTICLAARRSGSRSGL